MTPEQQALAVRRAAGLFHLSSRGLIRVEGSDRTRWLNAMLSNDVASLEPGGERSGCYALLLDRKGRILADFRVLVRPEAFWLESSREHLPATLEQFHKHIVADDVQLEDLTAAYGCLALEGPAARPILESAAGAAVSLAPEAGIDLQISGLDVVVIAAGWTGEPAYQLFAATPDLPQLGSALLAAGESHGLVEGDADALEILRIEAGTPLLGPELNDEVFPDEAGVGSAASISKGCYTGQEIVARLRSRGQVNHLLVGLRFQSAQAPKPDTPLLASSRRTGEVTSSCVSPTAGAIGLGFVRREHAAPGTEVLAREVVARVVSLPIVGPDAS